MDSIEQTCSIITSDVIDRINELHEHGANDEAVALFEEYKEWITTPENQEVILLRDVPS